MLPGFRFLCAAIVLSLSLLVFGFGATALLRSARQDVASLPVLRAPPETVFAQPEPQPRLAMLRLEPPGQDTDAAAVTSTPPIDPAPVRTEADRPAAPETMAALSPAPQPDAQVPQPPQSLPQVAPEAAPSDIVPAPGERAKQEATLTVPAVAAPAPPAIVEPPAPMLPEAPPVAAAAEPPQPAIQPSPAASSQISTTVATLDGPAVTITPLAAAKPVVAAPKKTVRKRTVKRKRVAAQAAPATAQAANPFAPPLR